MNRRQFVAFGDGATPWLSERWWWRCWGPDSGNADGDDGADGGDAGTLDTHPAAGALGEQPVLGPDPREAAGVIVVFEDPSCPSCARFEREVVPQMRGELVGPGTASLVFRGYPVIYPWGEPATRALEAGYDADPAAHWTLAEHYFAEQESFNGSDEATVYDLTESFLASETDLDAAGVVARARDGEVRGCPVDLAA